MIDAIELKNWRSHEKTRLSLQSGVNGLVGDMGAGKSSVLEALTYGLYGTLPAVKSRKINLDDLIRRHPTEQDQATVAVEFTIEQTQYRVERTLVRGKGTDKSTLREDGTLIVGDQTSEVTEAVTELLGIGFDLFTTIVYAEQNQMDFFLDLAPSDRREMIDDLLHLDRFEDARSNLVTLRNTIKQEYSAKKQQLSDEKDAYDQEEKQTLQEEIETIESTIEEKNEQRQEYKKRTEEIKERLDELETKKEQVEHLDKQITRLSGTRESIDNQIEQLQDEIDPDIETETLETIEERLQDIEKKFETLEELKERKQQIEKDLASLQQKRDTLDDELEKLESRKEKLEELDTVKDKLETLEEQYESLKEEKQRRSTERDQLEEQHASLQEAEQTCPVCEQQLDDEHQQELLDRTSEKIDQHNKRLSTIKENMAELEDDIEDLSDKRDTLLQYQGVEDKIEKKTKTKASALDEIEAKTDKRDEIQQQIDAIDVEVLEEKQNELEKIQSIIEKKDKRQTLSEQIEEFQEKRDELSFDQETFEQLQEEYNTLKSNIEVLNSEIESKDELRTEKQQRLDTFKEQEERIDSLEETIETLSDQRDFLAELETALKTTQEQMREEFVTTTNDVMSTVWDTVYPYEDYRSIRLDAGKDYRLLLEDVRGNEIPVEGEVSGGERHTAAFALRIALATVLTPATRLLILDEPTHNLDTRAIEQLGETLRNTIEGYMDQVLLITHDEQLESAVTGNLYRLQNDETTNGLTVVENPYADA